jgi:hypothetical protein
MKNNWTNGGLHFYPNRKLITYSTKTNLNERFDGILYLLYHGRGAEGATHFA